MQLNIESVETLLLIASVVATFKEVGVRGRLRLLVEAESLFNDSTAAVAFTITDKGRESLESFWEYAAFVINSLIFILIGVREAHQNFSVLLLPIAIAVVLVLAGRALAVYPLSALFSRSSLRVKSGH